MQEMGLEPTRYCYHRHLKPARLPIPPLLRVSCLLLLSTLDIIHDFYDFVNPFFKFFPKIFFIFLLTTFCMDAIMCKSSGTPDNKCGSVGTGRRARLRILWAMRSCGFKSHLPHLTLGKPCKSLIYRAFSFFNFLFSPFYA